MNMKKLSFVSVLFLTACVTINIYFPAAEAEEAADEIIQDIQNIGPDQPQSLNQPASHLSDWQLSFYLQIDHAISMFISSAHAEANLSVDSADIRRLTASMHARFSTLNQYYRNGTIGIQSDGLLTTKGKVSLKDRNKVNKLITAENTDRIKLYHAIAKANKHPEWFKNIKTTFAARWVRNAQRGWWYQLPNRSWKQK